MAQLLRRRTQLLRWSPRRRSCCDGRRRSNAAQMLRQAVERLASSSNSSTGCCWIVGLGTSRNLRMMLAPPPVQLTSPQRTEALDESELLEGHQIIGACVASRKHSAGGPLPRRPRRRARGCARRCSGKWRARCWPISGYTRAASFRARCGCARCSRAAAPPPRARWARGASAQRLVVPPGLAARRLTRWSAPRAERERDGCAGESRCSSTIRSCTRRRRAPPRPGAAAAGGGGADGCCSRAAARGSRGRSRRGKNYEVTAARGDA